MEYIEWGAISLALALGVGWLWERLSPEKRERINARIDERFKTVAAIQAEAAQALEASERIRDLPAEEKQRILADRLHARFPGVPQGLLNEAIKQAVALASKRADG